MGSDAAAAAGSGGGGDATATKTTTATTTMSSTRTRHCSCARPALTRASALRYASSAPSTRTAAAASAGGICAPFGQDLPLPARVLGPQPAAAQHRRLRAVALREWPADSQGAGCLDRRREGPCSTWLTCGPDAGARGVRRVPACVAARHHRCVRRLPQRHRAGRAGATALGVAEWDGGGGWGAARAKAKASWTRLRRRWARAWTSPAPARGGGGGHGGLDSRRAPPTTMPTAACACGAISLRRVGNMKPREQRWWVVQLLERLGRAGDSKSRDEDRTGTRTRTGAATRSKTGAGNMPSTSAARAACTESCGGSTGAGRAMAIATAIATVVATATPQPRPRTCAAADAASAARRQPWARGAVTRRTARLGLGLGLA